MERELYRKLVEELSDIATIIDFRRREGTTCYEYRDYETTRILSIYTIHEVGELDEYLINTAVESPKEAVQIIAQLTHSS